MGRRGAGEQRRRGGRPYNPALPWTTLRCLVAESEAWEVLWGQGGVDGKARPQETWEGELEGLPSPTHTHTHTEN